MRAKQFFEELPGKVDPARIAGIEHGYVFDVTSDPMRDIHLVLPLRYSDVLAIPAELVPGVKESPPKVRFEGP